MAQNQVLNRLRANRSGINLHFYLYFRFRLTFFDVIKGPNLTQTCPQHSVQFWCTYYNIKGSIL